jgi:hypothetical protein
MTKQEYLDTMQQEWELLRQAIDAADEGEKLRPRTVGEWSLKDIMILVCGWESVALDWLGRLLRDDEVPTLNHDELEAANTSSAGRRREWKLMIVEGEFENVHIRLRTVFDSLAEHDWKANKAGVQEWMPELTIK